MLLRELFALAGAKGGPENSRLPEPFPLETYSRWRAQFDERAARAYWAGLLQDFNGPTGVELAQPAPRAAASGEFGEPQTVELELDAARSASLQELAKTEAVTLSALVQMLWAIVLGNANNGCRDVVFGVVTSGRPAELAGIESAVGLFIQTLPLRARWTASDSLGALLAQVKEQNLQQMRYGYVPLSTLGRNLLDHLMVFENYPVDTSFDHNRVELRDMRSVFEDLGQCVVLCEARFAEAFRKNLQDGQNGQCGQRVLSPDFEALVAGAQVPGAVPHYEADPLPPDSPAYVIFTSGSTGRPKGVPIGHASVANRLLWMQSRFPIGQGDVVLQKTTITFDVSVWELFWWSWQGAGIALLEPNAEKNPALIVQAIEARRVTVLHFVPSM